MATPPRATTHSAHENSTKTHESVGKADYEAKPSFADDGTPRFAVFGRNGFVKHVPSEGDAELAVKQLEEADKAEAEEQKTRDKRRDANKAAGIAAAERRGETVAPEMHRFAEAHGQR